MTTLGFIGLLIVHTVHDKGADICTRVFVSRTAPLLLAPRLGNLSNQLSIALFGYKYKKERGHTRRGEIHKRGHIPKGNIHGRGYTRTGDINKRGQKRRGDLHKRGDAEIHGKRTYTERGEGHTRRRDYTERGLRGEGTTRRGDYTEKGLIGEGTTHRGDYTERRLHGEGTTRREDYMERVLYGERKDYTHGDGTHMERRLSMHRSASDVARPKELRTTRTDFYCNFDELGTNRSGQPGS